MNPTEPNSDNYSTDLNAIAVPTTTETTILNQEPKTLGTFLDRLYGTLFIPQATFEQLKANPSFAQGAIVIAFVNILETLRLDQFSIFRIIWSVISGIIGWLFFTFLLKQLASVFQNRHIKLVELLTLTGFASLPWLFMAPALSLPSQFRVPIAISVIIWFIVWQIWSAAIALEIRSSKALAIVPLAIFGGVVALIWLGNTFKLLLSITW